MKKNYNPLTTNIVVNPNDRYINEKLERLKKQDEEKKLFEAIVRAGLSGMD